MAKFILCYDLEKTNPPPYITFVEEAEKRGWSSWIIGTDKKWSKLPNTTLIGDFDDHSAARKSFDDAVAATEKKIDRPVTVEKYLLATYENARFRSDEKVDPDK